MGKMLAPASATSKLLDQLKNISETGQYTEFDICRLKKQAEKVEDIASRFSILSIIARIEGDEDLMRNYAKRSIEQSGGSDDCLHNYAQNLIKFNRIEEACDYEYKAYEADKTNFLCLDGLLQCLCILNRKEEFQKYIKAWNNLKKEPHSLEQTTLFINKDDKQNNIFVNEVYKNEVSLDEILAACGHALIRFLGVPLSAVLEIMPDSSHEPVLVAWVQWAGDFDEGMEGFSKFEDWYIEKEYDLITDQISFNIEFTGE